MRQYRFDTSPQRSGATRIDPRAIGSSKSRGEPDCVEQNATARSLAGSFALGGVLGARRAFALTLAHLPGDLMTGRALTGGPRREGQQRIATALYVSAQLHQCDERAPPAADRQP